VQSKWCDAAPLARWSDGLKHASASTILLHFCIPYGRQGDCWLCIICKMRTFPTRRGVIFILAFVISFVLFLQYGLGSLEAPQGSSSDWSRRITIPWRGGNSNNDPGSAGALKSPLGASNFHYSSGDARESAFVWKNGKIPTSEIRVHVPGVYCNWTGDKVMKNSCKVGLSLTSYISLMAQYSLSPMIQR
jgi:hypothetical protein